MKAWPILDYSKGHETYRTLHLWTQIIGKVRVNKDSWANHSWHSTLYVTSRGLSTSAIANGDHNFTLELDLKHHQFTLETSVGDRVGIPLRSEPIADFYSRLMFLLKDHGIDVAIHRYPNEIPDAIPFDQDRRPRQYNPQIANDFWKALVIVNNIFKEFRSKFVGKVSPVHFFWGSFDLAVTRFSGRAAPDHPGGIVNLPDRVTRDAYSHEVSSCGFWPGNEAYPKAAFYSYSYPEPFGFSQIKIPNSRYDPDLKEFILDYEEVLTSHNPKELVLEFCQKTYEAAANLNQWDRKLLEDSHHLTECQRLKTA